MSFARLLLVVATPVLFAACITESGDASPGAGGEASAMTIGRRDLRVPIAERPSIDVFVRKGGVDADGDGVSAKDGDCNDNDARVFPGQKKFFDEPYTTATGEKSFDYDCDGSATQEEETVAVCLGAASAEGEICSCAPGWSAEVPACGDKSEWSTTTACGPTKSIPKRQACR